MTATSAPASYASIAARIPAQPAPTTRTSWVASTRSEASGTTRVVAPGSVCHVGSLGERFRLNSEGHSGVAHSVFTSALLDDGLTFVRNDSWPTSVKDGEPAGDRLFLETHDRQMS